MGVPVEILQHFQENLTEYISAVLSIIAICVSLKSASKGNQIALWERRYRVFLRMREIVSMGHRLADYQQKGKLSLCTEINMLRTEVLHELISKDGEPAQHSVPTNRVAHGTDGTVPGGAADLVASGQMRRITEDMEVKAKALSEIILLEDMVYAFDHPVPIAEMVDDVRALLYEIEQATILFPKIDEEKILNTKLCWDEYIAQLNRVYMFCANSILAQEAKAIQEETADNQQRIERAYRAYLERNGFSCEAEMNCKAEVKELGELTAGLQKKRETAIETAKEMKKTFLEKMRKTISV